MEKNQQIPNHQSPKHQNLWDSRSICHCKSHPAVKILRGQLFIGDVETDSNPTFDKTQITVSFLCELFFGN